LLDDIDIDDGGGGGGSGGAIPDGNVAG